MTRPKRRFRPTNWLGPIVVSMILGAVAWTVTDNNQATSSRTPFERDSSAALGMTSSSTTASSTKILLSFSQPKSDRDRRVEVDLETGAMTDIPETSGWRAESLASRISQPASSLKIETSGERASRLTDGGEWNVTLRSTNGDAYQDPHVSRAVQ